MLETGLDSKHPSGIQSTVRHYLGFPRVTHNHFTGLEKYSTLAGERNQGSFQPTHTWLTHVFFNAIRSSKMLSSPILTVQNQNHHFQG